MKLRCDRCKREFDGDGYFQDEDTNQQDKDECLCPDCEKDNEFTEDLF